jgi:hypothetical protein
MRGHDDLAIAGVIHPAHQLQELHLGRRPEVLLNAWFSAAWVATRYDKAAA